MNTHGYVNAPMLGQSSALYTMLFLMVSLVVVPLPVLAQTLADRLEKPNQTFETIVQTGHHSLVLGTALTADERYAATASLRTVKVWETETGRELAKFYLGESWVGDVVFSPYGSLLLAGNSEGQLIAINWRTKKVLYQVQAHSDEITCLAVNFANRVVVTSSYDGSVKGWDINTGALLWEHDLQSGAVSSISNSRDGRYVVSGGGYRNSWRDSDDYPVGRVVVWDTSARRKVWALEAHDDDILSVAVSPDGRYAATGGYTAREGDDSDGVTLKLWDLKTGRLVRKFDGVTQSIWSIDFSADSQFLFAAGRYIQQINVETTQLIRTINPGTYIVSEIILGADDSRMLFSARSGTANLTWWSIPDEAPISRFEPKIASQRQVDISKTDQDLVLSASSDGTVMLWDLSRGEPIQYLRDISDNNNTVRQALFSNDGSVIVTVSGRELNFWDTYDGRKIRTISLPFSIEEIEFDPFDKIMAVTETSYENGSRQTRIHIYSSVSEERMQTMEGHSDVISDLAFAPDGSWLLSTSFDKTARAWDVKTGRQIASYGPTWGQIATGTVSPDSNYVVTGSNRGGETLTPVIVWDARTGDRLFSFRYPHWTRVQSLAFTPDGQTVVAGDIDGFVRAWHMDPAAPTGRELGRHDGGVSSVVVSSDGAHAWTSSEDGTLALWDVNAPERLISMVSRGMEWAVFDDLGNFDKSDGFEGIHFVIAGESVELDQFFDTRFAPRMLMFKARGKALPEVFGRVAELEVPPRVQIVSPSCRLRPSETICTVPSALPKAPGARWTVKVRAVSRNDEIAEIALYQNNKRVAGQPSVEIDPTGARTAIFSIKLVPGLNSLAAEAKNASGTISNTDRVSFDIASDVVPDVDLFVLAVGIDHYAKKYLKLNYAKKDAERITEVIRDRASGLYSSVNVKTMSDRMATKDRMIVEFKRIAAVSDVNDVFIFFYAGHGRTLFEENGRPMFFMVTHEVDRPNQEDELFRSAFSAKELLELSTNIPANKQVFLFDACESESVLASFQARGMPREKALRWLNRAAGIHIIAAARSRQLALEVPDLGHGAFSHGVIEAIQKHSFLTVGRLAFEVETKVREISDKYGSQQEATYYRTRFSQDFPLYAENRWQLFGN